MAAGGDEGDTAASGDGSDADRAPQPLHEALWDACPDIVLMFDLDGRVLDANPAALESLGASRAELIGRAVYELLPPDTANGRRAMMAEVLRSGGPVRRIDRKGARVFDNVVVPLRDASGTIHRVALYAREVTQAVEEQCSVHAARLEGEKREALRGLASDVAHQFNNLLTPIVTYLRLHGPSGDRASDAQRAALHSGALTSAQRASELVAKVIRQQVDFGEEPPEPRRDSADLRDGSLRVLAVDDEMGVLQVVEVALQMAGHEVDCFDSIEGGRTAFESAPRAYDVAVLDQNLRDGNGIDLAALIRRSAPEMLIVLASGRPTSELRERAEELGLRLLAKPFSVESLQGVLTHA